MRRRIMRLNHLLRQELSDLLLRQVNDPRLTAMVSITEVEVTPDLRYARVFVSVLGSPEEKKNVLIGLRSATKFLRHELSDRLDLRHVPWLTFFQDDSIERGARILSMLHELEPPAPEDGKKS